MLFKQNRERHRRAKYFTALTNFEEEKKTNIGETPQKRCMISKFN